MFGNIREIIESHYCFCKVSPYYIGSEARPEEGAVSGRRVHAGFDLDIYGVKMSRQPDPMAMLRIRITHNRAAHESACAAEHEAVKAFEAQLSKLGITADRRRA